MSQSGPKIPFGFTTHLAPTRSAVIPWCAITVTPTAALRCVSSVAVLGTVPPTPLDLLGDKKGSALRLWVIPDFDAFAPKSNSTSFLYELR